MPSIVPLPEVVERHGGECVAASSVCRGTTNRSVLQAIAMVEFYINIAIGTDTFLSWGPLGVRPCSAGPTPGHQSKGLGNHP